MSRAEWMSDEGGGSFVELRQYVGRDVTVVLRERRTCVLQTVIGPLIGVDEEKKVVHIGRGLVYDVNVVSKASAKKARLRPTYLYVGPGAVDPIGPGKIWAANWITLASIPGKLIREVVIRDETLGNIKITPVLPDVKVRRDHHS